MHSQREPIMVANASRLERVRQFGPPASIRSWGQHVAFDSQSTLLLAMAWTQPDRSRWWNLRGESDLPVCSPETPLSSVFCVLPGKDLVVAVVSELQPRRHTADGSERWPLLRRLPLRHGRASLRP